MKKESVSKSDLLKIAAKELFQNYAVLYVLYVFWLVFSVFVFQISRIFFSIETSLVFFRMIGVIPAGIFYVMPLVMMWGIIRFAGRNESDVITASELMICAFDYGIDCADEALIKNKNFHEIKREFQDFEPFMFKRMKRNFLWSMMFGMVVIIAIYKA